MDLQRACRSCCFQSAWPRLTPSQARLQLAVLLRVVQQLILIGRCKSAIRSSVQLQASWAFGASSGDVPSVAELPVLAFEKKSMKRVGLVRSWNPCAIKSVRWMVSSAACVITRRRTKSPQAT